MLHCNMEAGAGARASTTLGGTGPPKRPVRSGRSGPRDAADDNLPVAAGHPTLPAPATSEIEDMDLLHRLTSRLATWLEELDTRRELARLDDRCLADIGLERAGIEGFARAAARRTAPAAPDDRGAGTAVLADRAPGLWAA